MGSRSEETEDRRWEIEENRNRMKNSAAAQELWRNKEE
jgi:hypothetical protein